ncbi:hypothetical protein [Acinetobacter sp. CFCC 10889]|uniref:hypothetical protein n=1 Tax=Acinetobacter sp. CFCC 10889 TaxID=1775557 RepID=UPI000DD0AE06|nr:hypothetical protein [Acinetobacter sp. CFCC 10889]
MEKYLRLLNPKTINYEAYRIDGGVQQLTAQDVILAMSYAKLTPLQDNLIRLKCFGANTAHNLNIFVPVLEKYFKAILDQKIEVVDHHAVVIRIALTEFCAVTGKYSPTVRSRAVIGKVSTMVVHRHINQHIDLFLNILNKEFEIGAEKIIFQLDKTNFN